MRQFTKPNPSTLLRHLSKLDRLAIGSLFFCGLLIAFRFLYFHPADPKLLLDFPFLRSGNTLMFFVWNLFLAALPYFFIRVAEQQQNQLIIGILLLLWLVFLPNAPYVISDLKHLRARANVPYWYDVITFFTCAITGLMLGGMAVVAAARKLHWRRWPLTLRALSLTLFPLCGFGIYLGRVLRWNSWDLALRPAQLFTEIFGLFLSPTTMKVVLLYCLSYGLFLFIVSIGVQRISD